MSRLGVLLSVVVLLLACGPSVIDAASRLKHTKLKEQQQQQEVGEAPETERVICTQMLKFNKEDADKWSKMAAEVKEEPLETHFADAVITYITNRSPEHKSRPYKGGDTLSLLLNAKQAPLYAEVQKHVAAQEQYQKESDRPTIDVMMVKEDWHDECPFSIGIAGGTGPLSDATLLTNLMRHGHVAEGVNSGRFMINLFSAPPPRGVDFADPRQSVPYVKKIRKFGARNHQFYFLASNTAHLNRDKFISVSGQSEATVVNMVDIIGERIAKKHEGKELRVLILGTEVGYKGKLYPNVLTKHGFKAASVDNLKAHAATHLFYTLKEDKDAHALQVLIDEAKAGQRGVGPKLIEFIQQQIRKLHEQFHIGPDAVLLACTELPMVLMHDAALKEQLQHLLDEPRTIIDTEEMMIEIIAEHLDRAPAVPSPAAAAAPAKKG